MAENAVKFDVQVFTKHAHSNGLFIEVQVQTISCESFYDILYKPSENIILSILLVRGKECLVQVQRGCRLANCESATTKMIGNHERFPPIYSLQNHSRHLCSRVSGIDCCFLTSEVH